MLSTNVTLRGQWQLKIQSLETKKIIVSNDRKGFQSPN
jgi:hypothetical protein